MCKKHAFKMFGRVTEKCAKCQLENPEITIWRQQLVRDFEDSINVHDQHPYLKDGRWTKNDVVRNMRPRR